MKERAIKYKRERKGSESEVNMKFWQFLDKVDNRTELSVYQFDYFGMRECGSQCVGAWKYRSYALLQHYEVESSFFHNGKFVVVLVGSKNQEVIESDVKEVIEKSCIDVLKYNASKTRSERTGDY